MKAAETLKPWARVVTRDPVPCVFCRGTVYRLAKHPEGLAHSLPPCASFVRLEPDAFLTASITKVSNAN